jgi:hypothetical protein
MHFIKNQKNGNFFGLRAFNKPTILLKNIGKRKGAQRLRPYPPERRFKLIST